MSTEDLIGIGFRFPIRPNAKRELEWSKGPSRVEDAIWIILSTSRGERVMRPEFGAGVLDDMFEPNSDLGRARMRQAISDALVKFEPRIDVLQVRVDPSPSVESQVLATIDYRLRATNELFNRVFPLYLQEGAG